MGLFAALSPPRSISITGQNNPIDPLSERVAFIQATIDDNIDPQILIRAQHPGKLHVVSPRGVAAAGYFSMLNITNLFPAELVVFDANMLKPHMTVSEVVVSTRRHGSASTRSCPHSRPAHTCSGWRNSRPAHYLQDASTTNAVFSPLDLSTSLQATPPATPVLS